MSWGHLSFLSVSLALRPADPAKSFAGRGALAMATGFWPECSHTGTKSLGRALTSAGDFARRMIESCRPRPRRGEAWAATKKHSGASGLVHEERPPPQLREESGRKWCGREDSNFHGLPHSDLNAARLPIPPRPHMVEAGTDRPRRVANRSDETREQPAILPGLRKCRLLRQLAPGGARETLPFDRLSAI